MNRSLLALLALIICISILPGCARPVTTQSLLGQMTDLSKLAEYPDPPFTCRQFSSYDRASTSAANQETWFANADASQFLRVEERDGRKERVMMDADGPGAVVRIWSANPKGTLRIYLDGNDEPALAVRMVDLLGGKVPGIPSPIACERSRGWNCYFPFAYAQHCKITSDEDGFYYHVNYRTYARDARITTFVASDLERDKAAIAAIAKRLTEPNAASPEKPEHAVTLAPGEETQWDSPACARDSRAISRLLVKVAGENESQALRTALLTVECDGVQTITSPVGDFFGSAPGLTPYESLPLSVAKDGLMSSSWLMPYRQSATVSIRNLGDKPIRVWLGVSVAEHKWTRDSMYFYAQWRTAYDVPTRPFLDWNYVTIDGKGVFVGAAFSIANPVKEWWGEGDEKIYVDGEPFPSHFGTGTEDYYGYAWCCNETFQHAYHNQPRCDGPANYGNASVNRWDIIDCIPFQERFKFDMELWHWRDDIKVPQMSVVTYWYARPGATSNRMELAPGTMRLVEIPPYTAPRVAGALEGEEMQIIEHTGEATPQHIDPCSNEEHLWWRPKGVGDRLVVAFSAPEAGTYEVYGRFLTANDYGIQQLSINGEAAGEPRDFYHDGIKVTDEVSLGTFKLKVDGNQLAAEVVGANPAAIKRYMFGVDYLRLVPVKE